MKKIAVIGMSIECAGASSLSEFWNCICEGKNSINKTNKPFGCMSDSEVFDNNYFEISEKDSKSLDPQLKKTLENVAQAIRDAGYSIDKLQKDTAIISSSNYSNHRKKTTLNTDIDFFNNRTLCDSDFIASRTAFYLGFQGPAFAIQSACSSSLTSIDIASMYLNQEKVNYVVVIGSSIVLPQESLGTKTTGSMYSETGNCLPFSSKSDGIVEGNAIAVVILKRLDDAINDKDRIYSVIESISTNSDGNRKDNFFAPSLSGQIELYNKHTKFLNLIVPNNIKNVYWETHGTGTRIGDYIEFEGIKDFVSNSVLSNKNIYLGHIKKNIGHTIYAAGLVGLIKTCLVLYNQIIPIQSKQLEQDDLRDIENNLNTEVSIGIVSAFGIGGTNANVIISQHKSDCIHETINKASYNIKVSGKSKEYLNLELASLKFFIENNPVISIENIECGLNRIFSPSEYLFEVTVTSKDELVSILDSNIESIERNELTHFKMQIPNNKSFVGIQPIVFQHKNKTEKQTDENIKTIINDYFPELSYGDALKLNIYQSGLTSLDFVLFLSDLENALNKSFDMSSINTETKIEELIGEPL